MAYIINSLKIVMIVKIIIILYYNMMIIIIISFLQISTLNKWYLFIYFEKKDKSMTINYCLNLLFKTFQ
jgi:hypothetical protein